MSHPGCKLCGDRSWRGGRLGTLLWHPHVSASACHLHATFPLATEPLDVSPTGLSPPLKNPPHPSHQLAVTGPSSHCMNEAFWFHGLGFSGVLYKHGWLFPGKTEWKGKDHDGTGRNVTKSPKVPRYVDKLITGRIVTDPDICPSIALGFGEGII